MNMKLSTLNKVRLTIVKVLDVALVFGAGALLDPHVALFLGTHQGVATGVAVGIAVLRAVDKALGSKVVSLQSGSPNPPA